MSTSVLHRVIGLAGYRHLPAWDENGVFHLKAEPPQSAIRCPAYGRSLVAFMAPMD